MPALFADLPFARLQQLKQRVYAIPASAITAIVSIALGIAATAAGYSVLYGVLIDPYPYRDANHIALVNLYDKQGSEGDIPFTLGEIQQLRKAKSLADVKARRSVTMTKPGGGRVTTAGDSQ